MTPQEQKLKELEDRIATLETQMKPLLDIRIDQAAGGGDVRYSYQNVTIRPFGLMPPGSQS